MAPILEGERNSITALFAQRSAAESAVEEMKKAGLDAGKSVIVSREGGLSDFQEVVETLDISRETLVRLEALIVEGQTLVVAHGTEHEAQKAFTLLVNLGAEDVHFHRPSDGTARRAA